jgi:sugar/nucleoside kinase (ribokinase family)
VTFLQANIQEAGCMLGDPVGIPSEEELAELAQGAFDEGVRAVFLTMGTSGVLVAEIGKTTRIIPSDAGRALDTTGCGDVFGAATIAGLGRGRSPFDAATFGAALASRAASVSGIRETYEMAAACALWNI